MVSDSRGRTTQQPLDGVDFDIGGRGFPVDAIRWAKISPPAIERLSSDMLTAAMESLTDLADEANLGSARLHHVDLSEFSGQRDLVAWYVGDESWDDVGVEVTVQDGKIIAANAGDQPRGQSVLGNVRPRPGLNLELARPVPSLYPCRRVYV